MAAIAILKDQIQQHNSTIITSIYDVLDKLDSVEQFPVRICAGRAIKQEKLTLLCLSNSQNLPAKKNWVDRFLEI